MLGKLFGSLFGSSSSEPKVEKPAAEAEHKGFRILAEPRQAGSQWQVAGRILLEKDGETKEHVFIRADQLASRDDAAQFTIRKATLMIDQMGETLFKS